jgi:hypothetical protein
MDTQNADRFLRQLLLHRYMKLLERINELYRPTEAQHEALEAKILNISWLDEV